ncbi:hypothetical protein Anapl_03238 [Anas platyrhynchos]|uniref:Uncharacterized protein n=1 Tax=Anas platyrhynchos TaxID=8839 RepID=R0K4W5_ANAPL|nr:hypothetical protein Anapl_03238 [Anas platyrhynchos]
MQLLNLILQLACPHGLKNNVAFVFLMDHFHTVSAAKHFAARARRLCKPAWLLLGWILGQEQSLWMEKDAPPHAHYLAGGHQGVRDLMQDVVTLPTITSKSCCNCSIEGISEKGRQGSCTEHHVHQQNSCTIRLSPLLPHLSDLNLLPNPALRVSVFINLSENASPDELSQLVNRRERRRVLFLYANRNTPSPQLSLPLLAEECKPPQSLGCSSNVGLLAAAPGTMQKLGQQPGAAAHSQLSTSQEKIGAAVLKHTWKASAASHRSLGLQNSAQKKFLSQDVKPMPCTYVPAAGAAARRFPSQQGTTAAPQQPLCTLLRAGGRWTDPQLHKCQKGNVAGQIPSCTGGPSAKKHLFELWCFQEERNPQNKLNKLGQFALELSYPEQQSILFLSAVAAQMKGQEELFTDEDSNTILIIQTQEAVFQSCLKVKASSDKIRQAVMESVLRRSDLR